ncbi:MAG: hypothetical protein HC837_10715 [Chloroflexaceae bacterium]|nr:hypothetical protein [Chloroflexaceae bacterium]
MEEQVAEWLYDGVMALREGDREQALNLLMQVIEADERHEQGWLWLSGAVDTPEDQETALLNVLDINPSNVHARRGIEWLESQK